MESRAETIAPPPNYPPLLLNSSSSQTPIEQTIIKPQNNPNQKQPKSFPNHLQIPNVSPPARILCDILIRTPINDLDAVLASCAVPLSPEVVEEVLRLSYGSPSAAVKFFRWAGLAHKHTSYVWNLMVDLLGKNELFEPMWDAVRSMKQENALSVPTFVSVFGSYCATGRCSEALMSFDVMERYGVQQDIVALNSLLSAICHEANKMSIATEFFEKMKGKIAPDGDTFAILLEGWEKEGNAAEAKRTFGEMVIRVGWAPKNSAAYDAFLSTLVRASQPDEAIKFLSVMQKQNCFPGLKFFSDALDIFFNQGDLSHAVPLWDIMTESGSVPNLVMYNGMIRLHCFNNDVDQAIRLLDEMVFNGVFANGLTYNIIFLCLIKNKKVRRAGKFFYEMIKNEWPPSASNCAAAISMLFDGDDPEVAIDIWNFAIENHISPLDECVTSLLTGLCNLNRLSELRRYADNILDLRLTISESTMSKMEDSFARGGRTARESYDSIRSRWKAS